MNKMLKSMLALSVASMLVCSASAFAEQAAENAAKLYPVTVTLDPADVPGIEVTGAGIRGEFLFYESNMNGHTDEVGMADGAVKYPPSQYKDGMAPIGGLYYEEMTLNADGIYEVTLNLPAGGYPYQFIINPELGPENPQMSWANVVTKDGQLGNFGWGEATKNKAISDPKNPPMSVTLTGKQSNSELVVGDTARAQIADPAKRGTVTFQTYTDVDGNTQAVGVYLPAGYDRTKTYPLIIVSHGGMGNEADWFSQGQLNNIMDNMIAEGRTREAIVITPNNQVYEWDFEKITENIENCILPVLQTIYNISDDVHDRAFCGLSMGSMTTLYMYYHHSNSYDYYGAFSGGIAPGHEAFSLDDPHIREVKLLIGSAEEDIAYNFNNNGVPTTIAALKDAGIPYEPYFVTGSHDWFCWPDMFEYFAENTLWK